MHVLLLISYSRSAVTLPVHVVRDLGIYIDDELTMMQHVGKVTGACFYHLRRLRQIRRHVSNVLITQLIYACVTSRLDYCNSVLACLPARTIAPLQRVRNAAARLLLNRKKTDHITDGLKDLHWLPIAFRIQYKLCLLMNLIKVGNCPSYISRIWSACRPQYVHDQASDRPTPSWVNVRFQVPTQTIRIYSYRQLHKIFQMQLKNSTLYRRFQLTVVLYVLYKLILN